MVLSEKNNYCINKETVQNQALEKRTSNLASPWAGEADLMGCRGTSATPLLSRPQPPPRCLSVCVGCVCVCVCVCVDAVGLTRLSRDAEIRWGGLQASGTTSSRNGEKRAYLIVPETLYDMY